MWTRIRKSLFSDRSRRFTFPFLVSFVVCIALYYAAFQSDRVELVYSGRLHALLRVLEELELTEQTIVLREVIEQQPSLRLRLYSHGEPIVGSCVIVTSQYKTDGITVANETPLLVHFVRQTSQGFVVMVLKNGDEFGGLYARGYVSERNVRHVPAIADHPVVMKWLKYNHNIDEVLERYWDWNDLQRKPHE